MATEDELRDLSERIARLTRRELVRVLDLALDAEDRYYAEVQAENLRQIETLREIERQRTSANPNGAKREAG